MIVKGQRVCTNEQGRKYYDDRRNDLEGVVVYVAGSVAAVRYGEQPPDVEVMYVDCLQAVPETPRRGQ